MLGLVRRIADGLIGLAAIIGSAALLFEVVAIFADVVGRAFGAPITGRQDASQMTMTMVVFGGMAICDKVGGHIVLDIFETRFAGWLNRAIDVFAALLGAAIFLAIAWTMYGNAQISMMLPRTTNIIDLPLAWFQFGIVAFSLVTALGMILRAIELAFTRPDVRVEGSEARA